MKKIVSAIIVGAVISAMLPISALADEEHELSAHSAIVLCADTGDVIFEQNADERMLIASITKIMTAIVVIENADLDAQIAAMQKEDKAAADPKLLRSALRSVVKTLQSSDATVAEKNAAVRSVAENITWNKAANTLTVHYRLVL